MASGTPVVSLPLDGLDGVLIDDENAVVVPRPRLAPELVALLGDPDRRARLAAGGRATFEARFTIERSAQTMAEIYRWAVS
jgi:glycosyltransferase involved in cell wall biosynthesis